MTSLFSNVALAPRDPILGLTETFNADPRPAKLNLGVGVYYDDDGRLPLLQCVRAAEHLRLLTSSPRGYLPIEGLPAYVSRDTKTSERYKIEEMASFAVCSRASTPALT